jgi:hypothetical protein
MTVTDVVEKVQPAYRPIPTLAHGVIDYSVSGVLLAAPELMGFGPEGSGAARMFGAGGMMYSMMTRYEMGAFKVLPMRAHLVLDMVSGATMAVTPWLFGLARRRGLSTWLPFVLVVISEIAIAALTKDR